MKKFAIGDLCDISVKQVRSWKKSELKSDKNDEILVIS